MDDVLVKAVEEWLIPISVQDIQKFRRLAGHHRKFIKCYADLARPVSDLVRKHHFDWKATREAAFNNLKEGVPFKPVLS